MLSLSTLLAHRVAVWALLVSFIHSCNALTILSTNDDGPGTSTCIDSGLDWYTQPVGETPCKTYGRLRQICNSQFTVGTMNSNFPPDVCDDQVADCCCNSVAFALSMLCLNCQKGIGSSKIGYDAPAGTYEKFLTGSRSSFCSPVVNNSLPTSVQSAVCASDIHIMKDIYSRTFWGDGSWFYVWSSEDLTEQVTANASSIYGLCPSPSSSPSPTSTSPPNLPTAQSTLESLDTNSNHGSSATATIALEVSTAVLFLAFLGTGLFALHLWKRLKRETTRTQGPAGFSATVYSPFIGECPSLEGESMLQSSSERLSTHYTSEFDRSTILNRNSLSAATESEIMPTPVFRLSSDPFSDPEQLSVIPEANSNRDSITSFSSLGTAPPAYEDSTGDREMDRHQCM